MDKIHKNEFHCYRQTLKIVGLEYRKDGLNQPIAIICHGFMANRNSVKHYAKTLANLGYAAYCFDFAGGSLLNQKSDGKTTQMSVLSECEDLLAVIEYVKSINYTNENNILLMGCSQGGFVSSLVASKLKKQIKKLVLFYPALCIPDDVRSGKMMFSRFDVKNIKDIIWCGPMKLSKKYVLDVIDIDPYKEILDYENDVLIVHGNKDGIVKLDYSIKAANAYQIKKNRTVKFYVIDKAKHMFNKKHDKIAINYLIDFAK